MLNRLKKIFDSENISLASYAFLWLFLLITIICIFVPFSPHMPAGGLDPSWVFGMNQAVAQGLSFGKEIIFTFGPYASIYTKSYHPSTDYLMIGGSLYLAVSYWIYFFLLTKEIQWRWTLFFCAIFVGLIHSRDALLFSIPLMVGLVTFKTLSSNAGSLVKSRWTPCYVTLLFAPLGLLPLVKGSILILCGAVSILCALFFISNRNRFLAIVCLLSPLVSIFFFWVVSEQSVLNLPSYFISMLPLVSGYTEAMAIDGIVREVTLYSITSALLLLTISIQTQIVISSRIFLFCIYFIYLFIAFKAGFVRHDAHAVISSTSILIASLLLPFIAYNVRVILPTLIFSFISWAYIDSHHSKTSTESIGIHIKSIYSLAWHGIKSRLEDRNWPRSDFVNSVNELKKQASFPILNGSTDIYPYDQSYLIASGNTWSPRPILQSYSVYNPALAEANRNHLLGDQAPDNIIFKVEPIDERLPSIEDGVSWPVLIANYQPNDMTNDFLFLRKKEAIDKSAAPLKLITETHTFGEIVNIPQSNQPLFANLEINQTILGRLASIFFKPSQLQILLELKNGLKKNYRIIAGMAKSGFLISPLIENTLGFGMLYGKSGYLDAKRVKSITISPKHGRTLLWNNEYTLTFSQIRTDIPVDISAFYKFDQFDDELSGSKITAEKCDGSIDAVNGISPAPVNVSVSNILEVNGWLAVSVNQAILPEKVYVVLTDEQGKHRFLKTRPITRRDVGAYFKKPELNESGYSTTADISTLRGRYTLGLAMKNPNKTMICEKFKIPVTITN